MLMACANPFALKDSGLLHQHGFINGKWVDADDGKTFKITNPGTDEELGAVPDMGLAETIRAIQAAETAFQSWSKTTAKHRHDILIKMRSLMHEHADDLCRIITLENGKPLLESKGEVHASTSFFDWFAEEAVRAYGETIPSPLPTTRSVVIKQPIGVVAAVTPWNAPNVMVARTLGPALAAGCTVVLKPAPETPYSALAIAELARRAGVPDGVLNVVTTFSHTREVGLEMCQSPVVKKLTFTGSSNVAKQLYQQAAGTMKRVSIEAGGNAPFIVFNDAEVDEAVAECVSSKFRNSGQICMAPNRIYVQSGVYTEFCKRLCQKVSAFTVGDGLQAETNIGPLIHAHGVAKVARHVADAVQRGAQVVLGGTRLARPGSFFAPTVLSHVPNDALLTTEETFGPLVALITFETEEEVLRLANDSRAGLAGYFFSRDIGRVWRVAEALEVGMVGANTSFLGGVYAPFGGVKESGIGRDGAQYGIQEYMEVKLISFGGIRS